MTKGIVTSLIGLALVLSACTATPAGPQVERPRPSGPTPVRVVAECAEVSEAALAAVNAAVVADGAGNSLPDAAALFDPGSGLWLIAGAFAGPAAEGEGLLGIWAADTDVTKATFDGEIWALDGGARGLSTAEPRTGDSYEPENVPILGCWTRHQQ